ncbi:unnamed protein product [Phaedon cochleariae]|uniref:Nucleolus and neural progenitor protein-like N-terminal domain-containing protein n=1 Tax=Phaedon cochleariae TaxID=80249 RepID=A0A9N9SCH8_PHACE|nr:unnamed protein product [Phaedon cochleariae]
MNLWNVKDLPIPPVTTYRVEEKNIDLKKLFKTCETIKQYFEENEFMKAEYLVLSRIVYRMKQKFRSAKDFKALEKVHKALETFFSIQIPKYVRIFMDLMPQQYDHETYLPTKNLLDYILLRFQGLVKLLDRIVETCKIAGFLLDARMKVGHFWKVAFISFSLISRVYILAKYNANCICDFYSTLFPFSSKLQNAKNNWLPKEYVLPNDLKAWMNVDWMDIDDEIKIIDTPTEIPYIIQFFDLIDDDDDDDVEFCDEYVMVNDESDDEETETAKKKNKTKSQVSHSLRNIFDSDEDLGEVIDINDTISMDEENTDIDGGAKKICDDSVIEILDCTSMDRKTQDSSKKIETKNSRVYDTDEDDVVVIDSEDTISMMGKITKGKKKKVKKKKQKITKPSKIINDSKCYNSAEDLGVIAIDDDNEVDEMNDESVIEIVRSPVIKKKKITKKSQKTNKQNNTDEDLEVIDINGSICNDRIIEIVDQSIDGLVENEGKKKKKVPSKLNKIKSKQSLGKPKNEQQKMKQKNIIEDLEVIDKNESICNDSIIEIVDQSIDGLVKDPVKKKKKEKVASKLVNIKGKQSLRKPKNKLQNKKQKNIKKKHSENGNPKKAKKAKQKHNDNESELKLSNATKVKNKRKLSEPASENECIKKIKLELSNSSCNNNMEPREVIKKEKQTQKSNQPKLSCKQPKSELNSSGQKTHSNEADRLFVHHSQNGRNNKKKNRRKKKLVSK